MQMKMIFIIPRVEQRIMNIIECTSETSLIIMGSHKMKLHIVTEYHKM